MPRAKTAADGPRVVRQGKLETTRIGIQLRHVLVEARPGVELCVNVRVRGATRKGCSPATQVTDYDRYGLPDVPSIAREIVRRHMTGEPGLPVYPGEWFTS